MISVHFFKLLALNSDFSHLNNLCCQLGVFYLQGRDLSSDITW